MEKVVRPQNTYSDRSGCIEEEKSIFGSEDWDLVHQALSFNRSNLMWR